MDPSHDDDDSPPTDGEDEELHSFLTPTWTQTPPALPETKVRGGHLPRTGGPHVAVLGSHNMEPSRGHVWLVLTALGKPGLWSPCPFSKVPAVQARTLGCEAK